MKILLVEDTRAVAAVMTARLMSFGHDVVVADNGKKAVEQFSQISPDLVLMDIDMPVMNGFEACNRIRALEATKKWAWTPIIFLTASDTAENLITAIEAGGDDFLVKGISENVLQAKMKALSRIAAMRRLLSIANERLEHQASRDGLTGLLNRRRMDLDVDMHWAQCTQAKQAFALLMLDVDNFKKYNDHYGHQAGDDCLRAVAGAIEAVIVETNAEGMTRGAFVARYGGEEFAVIIPNASDAGYEGAAHCVLEAIRKLGIPHERNADWGIVTASIGGARSQQLGDRPTDLFKAADAALYRAKDGGRNRFESA